MRRQTDPGQGARHPVIRRDDDDAVARPVEPDGQAREHSVERGQWGMPVFVVQLQRVVQAGAEGDRFLPLPLVGRTGLEQPMAPQEGS